MIASAKYLLRKAILVAGIGFCLTLVGPVHAATDPGNMTYDESVAFSYYPIYGAGNAIAQLPLTAIDHMMVYGSSITFPEFRGPVTFPTDIEPASDFVAMIYGDCVVPPPTTDYEDSGGCELPVEIQTWPACMRNPAQYRLHFDAAPLIIKGAPAVAFEGGERLEIYTGISTIVIFGDGPARVRAVAESLRLVNGVALAGSPVYAMYLAPTLQLMDQLGILLPPVPGAMAGRLPCNEAVLLDPTPPPPP